MVKEIRTYVYVGQTRDNNGMLGRLSGHLKPNGTLSQRLIDKGIDNYGEMKIFACDLSGTDLFSDLYSRRRTALEYLVQIRLKVIGCEKTFPFEVISNVYDNDHIYDQQIINYADKIVAELSKNILKVS